MSLPKMDAFKSFYAEYTAACKGRDQAFLRPMFPAEIPAEEFQGVLEFMAMATEALEASGVTPTIIQQNERFDVLYQGDLGDGMTEMRVDFYFSDGQWLRYDPAQDPENQGMMQPMEGEPTAQAQPDASEPAPVPDDALVKAPDSNDRLAITPLGYLAAHDEVLDKTYAYAPYLEEQKGRDKYYFKIKAKQTAGTSLDPSHPSFRSNMAKAAVKGQDHVLVGFSMAGKDDDPRVVENRLYFDEALTPLKVEMALILRNADGSAKEPETLSFPWPVPASEPVQLITPPKSSASLEVEQLAYLTDYDVIADKDYAYLVTKEAKPDTGKFTIKVKAKSTAGASLDPSHPSFANNIEKAAKVGKDHMIFGFHLEPKGDDPRLVENRVYFDEAKNPTRVEIQVIVRKADGSAKERQVAEFPWPG